MNLDAAIDISTIKLIIPVIGDDVILVKDKDNIPISLHRYIAKKLTRQLDIPFTGQRIGELHTGYPNKDIMNWTNSIYNQITEDQFYTEPIEKLAAITDFNFYISTALDHQLEKALFKTRNIKNTQVKIIDYSLQQGFDPPENGEDDSLVTVFNLLGNLRNFTESAFTEEETLEHFFSLSNQQNRHPLADYFMKRIRNKILLFIGCDFPDWFMRFIIRIMTNQRYKFRILSDYIVSNQCHKYPELNDFLLQFKKNIITTGENQEENITTFINELYRRWTESVQNYPPQYDGSVFLSYNHLDHEKVKILKQILKSKGIRNVWFDIDDLHAGEYKELIEDGIKNCRVFIPLLSDHSLTNNQGYMWKEEWDTIERRLIADKFYKKKSFQIIPIILDNTARNDPRIPKSMREFSIWELDKNKERIIEEITKELTPIMKNK